MGRGVDGAARSINFDRAEAARERARVTRILYQATGQKLVRASIGLRQLAQNQESGPIADVLGTSLDLLTEADQDLRDALFTLSTLDLPTLGLAPALRLLGRHAGLLADVEVEVQARAPRPPLDVRCEALLFRVAQEILLNTERHGRATGVVVRLSVSSKSALLDIRDDGVDFKSRCGADWQSASWFALRALDRELRAVGGRLIVSTLSPRGVAVEAVIPRPVPSSAEGVGGDERGRPAGRSALRVEGRPLSSQNFRQLGHSR